MAFWVWNWNKKFNINFQKWGGGQRTFGTFPKIHPLMYRHPSLRNSIMYSPNFLLRLGIWRCPMYWSHHWLVSWWRPYHITSVKLIHLCYITYLVHLWEVLAYLETLCFNPSWILPISTNLWFVIGWSIQYITCGSTCSKLLLYPPRALLFSSFPTYWLLLWTVLTGMGKRASSIHTR